MVQFPPRTPHHLHAARPRRPGTVIVIDDTLGAEALGVHLGPSPVSDDPLPGAVLLLDISGDEEGGVSMGEILLQRDAPELFTYPALGWLISHAVLAPTAPRVESVHSDLVRRWGWLVAGDEGTRICGLARTAAGAPWPWAVNPQDWSAIEPRLDQTYAWQNNWSWEMTLRFGGLQMDFGQGRAP